ncbi:hexokinase type 2 isoform X18 [Spodoptera frugiperda]|uniref:Phosphotransferase n=1 Tax=Spodoptera frugiperda TaxID=7108 RepID=A0A9R0EDN0_SPOFR|nr:hexokinase type 2 isoform X12 [Spodoptera frugiperda]XP_050563349.1 hexokinase type 2 isoform X17 [Spodoptera frugiperda]XP_050563350.1 hexokinase type 2 isoform X18 [Spodoptera frugiperda]
MNNLSVRLQIREECEVLHLTDKQTKEIMSRLHNDLVKGLGKDTHADSIVKCWITYIQDLPNGKERGKFLALDLGGTNFRVLIINLGENHFDMQSKIYAIPNHIMTGTGVALFDHIAECLANFMKEHDVYEERLALGFTFSFPLKQLGLTKGILQRWTKGFSCSGVVGEDVVQGLKDAIARRGDVQIDICAILNDTTGTLMSCAWKNHNCKIGLIVGTGSNACYVEKTENCELFDGAPGKPELLINTEWGAFGDDGALDFVRTEFDREVDNNSINKGKQIQEKMISGMYMGELVRLALVKFTKMGLLFGGRGSDLLFQRGSFYTKYVSEIESDKPGDFTSCMEVLEELGLSHASEADMAAVRHVCECVSRRAAHLVSAGIACLLNKMNEPRVTVGIDGSVYRFHPHFHTLMCEKIAQLVRPGIQFDLMLSEDGSGRGAALVAAVACRQSGSVA